MGENKKAKAKLKAAAALISEELIVPIGDVAAWEKNPRGIFKEDFERLKRQILKLGVYKRLLCYRENGKYIVLGGNMRLAALSELGQREVAISVVQPKTEAEKLEYSLSDNDRAGFYQEQALAELLYPLKEQVSLEDFKIDLKDAFTLKDVLEQFGPDFIPKEKEITEDLLTENKCPKCGYQW